MISILGAGNGGLALAADLILRGTKCAVWNRPSPRLAPLIEAGQKFVLNADGIQREIKLPILTSDLDKAVEDSRIIVVVTPGMAHEEIATQLAPKLKSNQIVLLMPGRTYGSLLFYKELDRLKKTDVSIFEAQSILHTCRMQGLNLDLYARKPNILISSPRAVASQTIQELTNAIGNLEYSKDYLSITLNNMGAMLHPLPTILNTSRIESGEEFRYYWDGITPTIAKFIEDLDHERRELCLKLKCNFLSVSQWLKDEYGSRGENLFESLRTVGPYKGILAPRSLQHRYVIDDTLTGLVPLLKTGMKLGVAMPCTDLAVRLVSQIMSRDFLKEGRDFLYKDFAQQ